MSNTLNEETIEAFKNRRILVLQLIECSVESEKLNQIFFRELENCQAENQITEEFLDLLGKQNAHIEKCTRVAEELKVLSFTLIKNRTHKEFLLYQALAIFLVIEDYENASVAKEHLIQELQRKSLIFS